VSVFLTQLSLWQFSTRRSAWRDGILFGTSIR
jgi:hypothetical protein